MDLFNPLVDAVYEFGATDVDFRGFVHDGCLAFAYVETGEGVVFVLKRLHFRIKVFPDLSEIVVACDVLAAEDGGSEGSLGRVGKQRFVTVVGTLFVSLGVVCLFVVMFHVIRWWLHWVISNGGCCGYTGVSAFRGRGSWRGVWGGGNEAYVWR